MNLRSNSKNQTALVVEDSEDYALILQSFLSKEFNVLVANNINSAIEVCLIHNPEIIITDLHLGNESGFELLDRVSKLHLYEQPLVFLSTGTLPNLTDLTQTNILDTFVKPYCPMSLSQIVKTHLLNSINCISIKKPKLNSNLKIGYLSRSTPAFDGNIETLVANAQKKNESEGITGCLFFDGNNFFQFLEGEYQKVIRIFHSIYYDPRHSVTEFTSLNSGEQRIFNGWGMERISESPASSSYKVFLSKIQVYLSSLQPSSSAKLNKIVAQILASNSITDSS